MHRWLALSLALGLAALAAPAAAQDAEALRKELAELRRQLDQMSNQYQKAIDTLAERLQRLEAQPQAVAAPRPSPTVPPVAQVPAGQPPSQPSLTDLARPRQPFSLAEQSGRGQILFDVGVAGDFVGNVTQGNVDKANRGTFPGLENRFFPREIELGLFGQIDPFARGEVRLEAAEEFEDGERRTNVSLAEAHLTLLTSPFDTQIKLGQMRNRFGYLNQFHLHDRSQPDSPNVLARFFGQEGLREQGAELTWVAPLPFYLETLVGLFTGDNEEAFGRGSLKAPLATGRLRTFFELGDFGAIQLGASVASGETADRRHQTFAGYDVKYKLTPEGRGAALLTLASEGIWSRRRVEVLGDPDGDGVEQGERRTRERFGWYLYGEVQPWRRWAGGLRYDSTQFLADPGREWAIEPYLVFKPSEFLRFRVGYKRTERDRREPFALNGATARTADEILFQGTFILGAHPAHPF